MTAALLSALVEMPDQHSWVLYEISKQGMGQHHPPLSAFPLRLLGPRSGQVLDVGRVERYCLIWLDMLLISLRVMSFNSHCVWPVVQLLICPSKRDKLCWSVKGYQFSPDDMQDICAVRCVLMLPDERLATELVHVLNEDMP